MANYANTTVSVTGKIENLDEYIKTLNSKVKFGETVQLKFFSKRTGEEYIDTYYTIETQIISKWDMPYDEIVALSRKYPELYFSTQTSYDDWGEPISFMDIKEGRKIYYEAINLPLSDEVEFTGRTKTIAKVIIDYEKHVRSMNCVEVQK